MYKTIFVLPCKSCSHKGMVLFQSQIDSIFIIFGSYSTLLFIFEALFFLTGFTYFYFGFKRIHNKFSKTSLIFSLIPIVFLLLHFLFVFILFFPLGSSLLGSLLAIQITHICMLLAFIFAIIGLFYKSKR